MDYYVPRLANKERVPLPMQLYAYKYNFLWPQHAAAAWPSRALKGACFLLSLLCYMGTVLAEFTFIGENPRDIPALTDCLSTTFMGMQYIIRMSLLAWHTEKWRVLLERFYAEIYFTTSDDPQLHKEIKTITRFTSFFTKLYYMPMVLIFVAFISDVLSQGMASRNKPYIFRMSFRWYDAQSPLLYVITCFYTGWLNMSTVTLMSAEDFSLCLMLCHTSYRYKVLQRDLSNLLRHAQADVGGRSGAGGAVGQQIPEDLHRAFRRRLYSIFKRQQRLFSFVEQAKTHFTYQIFYCLFFGVGLLCVVLFQLERTTIGIGWVKYVIWIISQAAQFIMIGYFGQMLMDETMALQNSYYMCQWEELLPHGDEQTNKQLLSDIRFAILDAKKPVVLEGMKMFPLSHSTVGSALRTAMSYFMFLKTMNGK